jgi:hypothetical protein
MINIPLFLLIGLAGVIITIAIYFSGREKTYQPPVESKYGQINVLNMTISIVFIVYLFRFLIMFFTGFFSGLYLPVILGGIFALLPIVFLVLVNLKNIKLKV